MNEMNRPSVPQDHKNLWEWSIKSSVSPMIPHCMSDADRDRRIKNSGRENRSLQTEFSSPYLFMVDYFVLLKYGRKTDSPHCWVFSIRYDWK